MSLSNKKQREIYVGNLTIGVVTDTMLRDLFNGALAHLVPDPVANPPVINAALDPSGTKYSKPSALFATELRTFFVSKHIQLVASLCTSMSICFLVNSYALVLPRLNLVWRY